MLAGVGGAAVLGEQPLEPGADPVDRVGQQPAEMQVAEGVEETTLLGRQAE